MEKHLECQNDLECQSNTKRDPKNQNQGQEKSHSKVAPDASLAATKKMVWKTTFIIGRTTQSLYF